MKKFTTIRALVVLMTFVAMVLGTGVILQTSSKIIKTSVQLIGYHDNAAFYNEQARKTDEMTEEYLENDRLRKEIYNSEDDVIRIFSNQNFVVKTFILFVALGMYPVMLLVWVTQARLLYIKLKRRLKKYNQEQERTNWQKRKVG